MIIVMRGVCLCVSVCAIRCEDFKCKNRMKEKKYDD